MALEIYDKFIREHAPYKVNLPGSIKREIDKRMSEFGL